MYNQNPKLRNTSSIGRTAQIHDYHMLHVAAWPTGVCAWSHILCPFGLPSIKAAEANYIMTQACLAAAIGRNKRVRRQASRTEGCAPRKQNGPDVALEGEKTSGHLM